MKRFLIKLQDGADSFRFLIVAALSVEDALKRVTIPRGIIVSCEEL